jgi:hypothetical protein
MGLDNEKVSCKERFVVIEMGWMSLAVPIQVAEMLISESMRGRISEVDRHYHNNDNHYIAKDSIAVQWKSSNIITAEQFEELKKRAAFEKWQKEQGNGQPSE